MTNNNKLQIGQIEHIIYSGTIGVYSVLHNVIQSVKQSNSVRASNSGASGTASGIARKAMICHSY
jgi:hypothetical protein